MEGAMPPPGGPRACPLALPGRADNDPTTTRLSCWNSYFMAYLVALAIEASDRGPPECARMRAGFRRGMRYAGKRVICDDGQIETAKPFDL